jgi:hypothetical protein
MAACAQTSGNNARLAQPNPSSGVVATSDPLVLSGVAYTQGDAATQSKKSPEPPPNTDIIAVPAGGATEPVVSSTPLPATDPALIMPSVTAGQPDAPLQPLPAPVTTADGYPNINVAPKQPQSKLLTPEERAKLIEELNALAGRSGAAQ